MSVEHGPSSSVDERIKHFYDTAQSYVDKPPLKDPYFSAFAQGMIDASDDSQTGVGELIGEAVSTRVCSSSQMVKQILDKLQFDRIEEPGYPYDYGTPDSWSGALTETAQDAAKRQEFLDDVTRHVLSSTVVSRQVAVPLVAAVYKDRFTLPPTLADFGSGLGIGDVQLANRWGFEPFENMIFEDEGLDDYSKNLITAELQAAAHVFPSMPFDKILSIDKQSAPTQASIARDRSSSHYPVEWSRAEIREHFDALLATGSDLVEYIWNTDMETNGRLSQTPEGGCDIGFASTWFYQLAEDKRQQTLENCLNNLSEDGVFILQDFAVPDSDNTIGVKFLDNWFSRTRPYQTMVLDKREPDAGFRTLFRWTNGRARDMEISKFAADKLHESM